MVIDCLVKAYNICYKGMIFYLTCFGIRSHSAVVHFANINIKWELFISYKHAIYDQILRNRF